MQRIIKFRAWDKAQDPERMLSWKECLKHFHGCYEININPFEDSYLTWMQFTGLYDKNGKEIYEGDIVKDTNNFKNEPKIRKVVYSISNAWFPLRETTSFLNYSLTANNDDKCSHLEVIGNIYENPELIK